METAGKRGKREAPVRVRVREEGGFGGPSQGMAPWGRHHITELSMGDCPMEQSAGCSGVGWREGAVW